MMKTILNDMESIEELENKYQGEQLRFDPMSLSIIELDYDAKISYILEGLEHYAYDVKNSTSQTANDAFEKKTTRPSYSNGWNDVSIQIGVAVYGGGYSTAASGTSLSNTTVLRYTAEHNNIDMKYSGSKEGNINYANGIDISTQVERGYSESEDGNTWYVGFTNLDKYKE